MSHFPCMCTHLLNAEVRSDFCFNYSSSVHSMTGNVFFISSVATVIILSLDCAVRF